MVTKVRIFNIFWIIRYWYVLGGSRIG